MATLTLTGEFWRRGIKSDPVVFVEEADVPAMLAWWVMHAIFTQIWRHRHPRTGRDREVVYLSAGHAEGLTEGEPVTITLGLRPEKRGTGIRVLNVERLEPAQSA